MPSEAMFVDACELEASPDDYMNRNIVTDVRIWNSQHGIYADGDLCPDAALWVGMDRTSNPDIFSSVIEAASEIPEKRPLARVRGQIAMENYNLPLTNHVSPRLQLKIAEVLEVTPAQ